MNPVDYISLGCIITAIGLVWYWDYSIKKLKTTLLQERHGTE